MTIPLKVLPKVLVLVENRIKKSSIGNVYYVPVWIIVSLTRLKVVISSLKTKLF